MKGKDGYSLVQKPNPSGCCFTLVHLWGIHDGGTTAITGLNLDCTLTENWQNVGAIPLKKVLVAQSYESTSLPGWAGAQFPMPVRM